MAKYTLEELYYGDADSNSSRTHHLLHVVAADDIERFCGSHAVFIAGADIFPSATGLQRCRHSCGS